MDGGERPKRVSLADVARRAGTSHSAASRALNGRPGVRPDHREAVLAAAAELGYIPNTSARNLVMQRTGLVALAFADPDVLVGSVFFADLVSNIVSGLDDSGYRTVLLLPNTDRVRTMADVVFPGAFDGALVVGHRSGDGLLDHFISCDIPTVTLGRPLEDVHASSVDVDNVAAAAMASEHLLEHRSHPALLACAPDTSWGADRAAGYTAAMQARQGAAGTTEWCEFSNEGGYHGTMRLLERAPETDAVLVTSATILLGVLNALADSGRRVPDDVTLVSFDDEPRMAYTDPPITAVRQPLATMGREMANIVIEMIADPDTVSRTELSAVLVIRGSSLAPSSE